MDAKCFTQYDTTSTNVTFRIVYYTYNVHFIQDALTYVISG